MPYNPNDPNSDPNNPEGTVVSAIPVDADTERLAEEAVRMCYPQAVARSQVPEALETVEKLGVLWNEYRDRVKPQTQAFSEIDALISTAKSKNVFDEFTIEFVDKAVVAIKKVNV